MNKHMLREKIEKIIRWNGSCGFLMKDGACAVQNCQDHKIDSIMALVNEERKEWAGEYVPNTFTIQMVSRGETEEIDMLRQVMTFEQMGSRKFVEYFIGEMFLKMRGSPVMREMDKEERP